MINKLLWTKERPSLVSRQPQPDVTFLGLQAKSFQNLTIYYIHVFIMVNPNGVQPYHRQSTTLNVNSYKRSLLLLFGALVAPLVASTFLDKPGVITSLGNLLVVVFLRFSYRTTAQHYEIKICKAKYIHQTSARKANEVQYSSKLQKEGCRSAIKTQRAMTMAMPS